MDFLEMDHEILPILVGIDVVLDDVLDFRGFGPGSGKPFGDVRDLLQDLVLAGNQKRVGGDFPGLGFEVFLVALGLQLFEVLLVLQPVFQLLFLHVFEEALLAFLVPEKGEHQGGGDDDQGCEESQESEPAVFELDVLLGDGEFVLRVLQKYGNIGVVGIDGPRMPGYLVAEVDVS